MPPEYLPKAHGPIVATPFGIVRVVICEDKSRKAASPMEVMLLGIVSEVRLEAPRKAMEGIVVIPFPILSEVMPDKLKNEAAPIEVTLLGSTIAVIEVAD